MQCSAQYDFAEVSVHQDCGFGTHWVIATKEATQHMERSAKADVYARRSCTPPQVVWRLRELATAILMNSTTADAGCVPWPAQLPQK
jgi:hypothetical protein